jgi:hypothetical protein
MKKALALLLFGIALVSGCKKSSDPYPTLTLQYQSSQGNYSQSCQDNGVVTSLPLILLTAVGEPFTGTSDSIPITYAGTLSAMGTAPSITISIYHTFSKNQLDSIGNNLWVPRNANDFYSLFNNGGIAIGNFYTPINQGVTITLSPTVGSSFYYSLANDTSTHFVITGSYQNLDWSYFLANNLVQTPGYRIISVAAVFSGKFCNTGSPYDTLVVSNGIYKGVFVDRL